jgi:hypothetical protein
MRISFKPWMLIIITVVLFGVLAGLGGLANVLYWHPQDPPWIRSFIFHAPVPVARVGGNFVSYKDYLIQRDAAQTFLTAEAASQAAIPDGQVLPTSLDTQAKKLILDQLIRATAVKQLAEAADLRLTDEDVTRSFEELIARAGTSTNPGEIDAYLKTTFGWTRQEFSQRVVRPATLETAVKQEVYKDDDAAFQAALSEKTKGAVVYIRL